MRIEDLLFENEIIIEPINIDEQLEKTEDRDALAAMSEVVQDEPPPKQTIPSITVDDDDDDDLFGDSPTPVWREEN